MQLHFMHTHRHTQSKDVVLKNSQITIHTHKDKMCFFKIYKPWARVIAQVVGRLLFMLLIPDKPEFIIFKH